MIEEYQNLLKLNWTEEEIKLIKKMFDNLHYYKSFTSKASKNDIGNVIQIIIKIKNENENCKCKDRN